MTASDFAPEVMHPDELTRQELSVVMRGYDREQVDMLLRRVGEGYLFLWREGAALRERLGALERQPAATEGEALESARSVGEIVQRCATAEDQLMEARARCGELEAALDIS